MDIKDIENLVFTSSDIPHSLNTVETALFVKLRFLYASFNIGAINREQGAKEKQRFIKEYKTDLLWFEIHKEHIDRLNKSDTLLADANKSDCERCKKLARIIDGRDAP